MRDEKLCEQATLPTHLYKYSAFDEWGRKKIEESEVFFAPPKSFNDPFDCRIYFDLSGSHEEKRARIIQANERRGIFDLERADRFLEMATDEVWERIAQGMLAECLPRFGVLPLSEKGSDLLMFAHYADQHRGFCLQFDTTRSDFFEKAKPVLYSTKYPVVEFMKIDISDEDALGRAFQEGLFRKSPEWKYEAEWRIVNFGGPAAGAYQYPVSALSAVILGCQMLPKNVIAITELVCCRHPQVKLLQARVNNREFKLDLAPVEWTT